MLFLLAPVVLQQRYTESEQLRTSLPNGANIYCERRDSKYISVQLILSSRDAVDQPGMYGYRHLLEHIVSRSIPGHDREIEKVGGTLFASTSRDWMQFEWRLPAKYLQLAYVGMDRILRDCGVTPENIQREAKAIGHEVSLLSSTARESREAWRSVFGEEGLDPLGNFESVSSAKPEDLRRLWAQMTKGPNVVISACGSIDIKSFTQSCRAMLAGLAPSKRTAFRPRAIDGSFRTANSVALPIPAISTNGNAAAGALVAAFGLASRLNRPYVTYTPADRTGLAIIGSLDGFESIADVVQKEDPATIFVLGRLNAQIWLDQKMSTPEGSAELNGTFLSLSEVLRPNKLAERLQLVTYEDFLRNWNLIREVVK